ncbi:hypothetical protein SAMN05216266_11130 [Amycolatopsis marina]|uniref:Uncharacterized protein n=1 Tax=Amycolatopsis marina TaxID=490629 RepID=A0A1I1AXP1_9PSEU|nr:hypothetical protein [Amycolatopsis marina]SFB42854.1 hypothetical protein SAMN05216266_11130 [Amycolatopsis marina]
MHDTNFEAELERRIALLEAPDSEESVLPDLPARDILLAVLTIAALSVGLIFWGYPA